MREIWMTDSEARAAEAATVQAVKRTFDDVLKIIMARYGIGHQAAVHKMKQFDFTLEELQKVAAKNKTKVTVHAEQPKPGDKDEEESDADERLDKLGEAVRHVNPTFSKAQAVTWAIDNLPEARELLRQSKQHSIGKNHQHVFEKVERDAPQAVLPNIAFGKMTDADLSSLYREGHFDKMGDHSVPSPARGVQGTHTDENQRSWQHSGRDGSHSQENARPVRDQSAVANTDTPPKPKVRRDSADAADFDAGNARVSFAVRLKELQKAGLNFDQAASKAMREAGINPQPISP